MHHPSFIKPRYDSGGFSSIPQMVKSLLTSDTKPLIPIEGINSQYDIVVLFLIDGFGWRLFEKHQDGFPFLREVTEHGVVTKLVSQFPSTTAAQITCIHTGLPVGQNWVFEWQYYEPHLDAVITPLLFSYAGTTERDMLKSTGVDPRTLYPTKTLYQDLGRHGVTSFVFQHREYTPSTFSDIVFDGANIRPYKTFPEALVNMRNVLTHQTSPIYICLYFDKLDAISHDYGPNSPQIEAEIDTLLTVLDRQFMKPFAGKQKKALFILTADHGQIDVDPGTTVYLNRDPAFVGYERFLKTNQKGELLVPAGSCRDVFLYIRDGLLDEAQDFLSTRLAGKAEVHKVQTLIEQGYFGLPPVSPEFLARVGDLVILPNKYESVWWYEKGKFEQKYYGHHGGLTPEEMEIPFLVYDMS